MTAPAAPNPDPTLAQLLNRLNGQLALLNGNLQEVATIVAELRAREVEDAAAARTDT